jgi:hypothetical protein
MGAEYSPAIGRNYQRGPFARPQLASSVKYGCNRARRVVWADRSAAMSASTDSAAKHQKSVDVSKAAARQLRPTKVRNRRSGVNDEADRERPLPTPSEPFRSLTERSAALAQSHQFEHVLGTSARPQRTGLLDADPLFPGRANSGPHPRRFSSSTGEANRVLASGAGAFRDQRPPSVVACPQNRASRALERAEAASQNPRCLA